MPAAQLPAARAAAAAQLARLREVYGSVEPDVSLQLAAGAQQRGAEAGGAAEVVSAAGAGALLSLLQALPNGVVRMSPSLPGESMGPGWGQASLGRAQKAEGARVVSPMPCSCA